MIKKKPSEISEVIYEAQDPIDETSDLDETDVQTEEEIFYTNREMHIAIAKGFVRDLSYTVICAVCCLSTFLPTSYLLIGSDNLLNNQNYSIQKEKAAICEVQVK